MDIPFDLLHIVASYLVKPKMILLDWIDKSLLHWDELIYNPNASCLIETIMQENPEQIRWEYLSRNPNIISLLEIIFHREPDKLNWHYLSTNRYAIHLLEKCPDKIDWDGLSENPNAIHLLEKHPEKINMSMLSGNPNAIHLIEEHLENPFAKIDWNVISRRAGRLKPRDIYDAFNNPDIKHLLQAQSIEPLDTIYFNKLSSNPNAFHLLEKYPEKINWSRLSENPNFSAVNKLLEKYIENPDVIIDWEPYFENPNIDIINTIIDAVALDDTLDSVLVKNRLITINWDSLSLNPNAIHIFEKFVENKYIDINWYCLSKNPKALHILKKYPDKIDYEGLTANPSIFEIDTEQLKKDILCKAQILDKI
jgi:hypothetical protein